MSQSIKLAQGGLAIAFIASIAVVSSVNSETAPNPQPTSTPGSQIQRVQVFDDRVFILGSDKPPPSTSKSTTSGAERYLADDPDYNTGQRNEWINNCSSTKDQKAFKECFEKQRSEGRQRIKENMNRSGGDVRSPWRGDPSRGKGLPKE